MCNKLRPHAKVYNFLQLYLDIKISDINNEQYNYTNKNKSEEALSVRSLPPV